MAWKSAQNALFHPTHSRRRLFLREEDRQYRRHADHTVSDPDLRSCSQGGSLVASTSGPILASGEVICHEGFSRQSELVGSA